MSKYEKLDAAIIQKIKDDGRVIFRRLFSGDVRKQCVELSAVDKGEPFRYLDRRLQALRKSGQIYCSYNGWGLTNVRK